MALRITPEQLAVASFYVNAGDYAGGWEYLASVGDNYADNAYVVTTGNGNGRFDNLMHRLVKDYWETVAGPGAHSEKFSIVALQHFEQYVAVARANGGVLPNSREIEGSYRVAVTQNNLPPNIAIDGAITQSFGELFDRLWPGEKHEGWDWSDALGMEDARQVASDINNDLGGWQSYKDLTRAGLAAIVGQIKNDLIDILIALTRELSDFLTVNDLWRRAMNWTWPRDPIILDLNGDGLETVGLNANVYFDHNGDGVLTKTGWAGQADALLVWDRSGNGAIDTGAELFGDFTPLPNETLAPNGFAALAALDSNGDGILDARDPAFAELRLWRDADQNGQTGAGELIPLAQAGVASLRLAHDLRNQRLANGNTLSREGSFTRTDGSVGAMGEFRLVIDTFDTRFAETIEVPESLRTLPDMGGSGNVRDLRQAAARSGELAGVVAEFQDATGHAEQWALLDRLLTAWADTSGMARSMEERAAGKYRIVYEALGNERRDRNLDLAGSSSSPAGSVPAAASVMNDASAPYLSGHYRHLIDEWSRKLHVLEAFNGQYFFNLPGPGSQTDGARSGLAVVNTPALPQLNVSLSQNQLDLLQQAYDNLKESVYAGLVMQTRLKPYLDALELVVDDQGLRLDAGRLEQMLADKRVVDPENHLADLLALDRYAGQFLAGTNWRGLAQFDSWAESLPQTAAVAALLAHFQVRTLGEGDDRPRLAREADIVLAGAGHDTLIGDTGNDRLFGQGGDDRLHGGDGDDLLSGGAGDDALHGESGADTYVFGRGFGNDLILDTAEQGVRRDSVRFLGLAPADVRTTVEEADNLAFTIVDTGETLRVPAAGYWWGPNGVGQYVFDDGTVWSHEDALRSSVGAATGNDDLIHGSSAADTIAGLAGNDTLVGGAGDDVLDGGAGDDILIGASGWEWTDDTRRHRQRSATPQVSANGNDTYLFGRGEGCDTVIDGDLTPGSIDTLRFKEGISPTDVRISRSGSDLVLALRDSGDQVVLARYFEEAWNGTAHPYLIERIAFANGTVLSFADVQVILFAGSEASELIIGSRGADVLTGRGGDDVLLGGERHDTLDGGPGDDVLRGGGVVGANGQLSDWHGAGDTYRFGRGDGHDTLIEDSWLQGETDRIELKPGLGPDDVRLERVRSLSGGQVSDDLRITLRDSGETLTVRNHFSESKRHAVELIAFDDGTEWDEDAIRSRSLVGDASYDDLRGFDGRDDVIEGGAGNDRLLGLDGNDVLRGGAGDDILEGGSGSDTYRFGLGDGQDVIIEGNTAGDDAIELGAGIAPADVTVRWTLQGDMAVVLPDGSRVTVRGQALTDADDGIEQLRWADGTSWDRRELASRALAATDGDDTIVGSRQADTLDGGKGNDRFEDLGGDDTYLFGVGDGQDTIIDTQGRLLFQPGIGPNDIRFTREAGDLIVTLGASHDSVRIKDWLASWQRIDRFDFDNGSRLSVADVLMLLDVREGSELLYGSPGDDVLTGSAMDSVLYGREGDDVLSGGDGRDELHGEDGNDLLDGGPGRDVLHGGKGRNTYVVSHGMGLDHAVVATLAEAQDTVVFSPDIRVQDVSVQRGSSSSSWPRHPGDIGYASLVIGIGGDDALVLRTEDGDDLGRGALQRFRFEDGTEWTLADLLARADDGRVGWQQADWLSSQMVGSQADDTLRDDGSDQSLTVKARGNDDEITLGAGNDIVSAGTGRDSVSSGRGDDLIAGEAGNDHIDAGEGDDVIVFNEGVGHDHLSAGPGVDTLSFGTTVTPAMLSAALDQEGRVVLLVDGGAGGSITLSDTAIDDLPGDLERLQFIDAAGHARLFDLAAWLRANRVALLAATPDAPHAFDGAGFELTGAVAPAGGIEAVAYAQTSDLFATATLPQGPSSGDDVVYGTPTNDTLEGGAGNDIILGLAGDDVIAGNEGNDLLQGGDGNDMLDGGAGADVLHGGRGADTLTGGGGGGIVRDELYGGQGGDTYLYQPGDGEVVIDDEHRVLDWGLGDGGRYGGAIIDSEPNVLAFGPGIRPEELRYSALGEDLVIEFDGRPGDRVILRGHVPGRATQTRSVDIIRFADGTQIVGEPIDPSGMTVIAGDEGEWLNGTPLADTLFGGDGDDVLDGRGGADRLWGGTGSDTYRIHKDWGHPATETLIGETWRAQERNRIELTGDFAKYDLQLEFDGRDLLLRLSEDGDRVRFAGFDPRAPGMQAPVAEVSLPWSGASLSFDELLARGVRFIGTPGNDVLTGTALSDWIEGREGDDIMSGGAGGDTYVVEADGGTDTLIDKEEGGAPNVLVLPWGTSSVDVRLSYDGEGFLVLDIASTGNRVRLSGFDPANPLGPRAIERFRSPYIEDIGYEDLLARGFDIFGTEEGDALKGTALADVIRAGGGNDLIVATPGGDWLLGQAGNDVYVVTPGDGIVDITDVAEEGAGNVLRFGPGVDPDSLRNKLRFEAFGDGQHALVIPYGSEGDVVYLSGFDPAHVLGPRAIDRFEFADGTVVDYATLVSWTFVVEGTPAAEALAGTDVGDRLYGYEGDDLLEAADGDDVLTGGAGNDVLRGGAGRDAYAVKLGNGEDLIEDEAEAGIGNVLSFGEGIAREDVAVEVRGEHLLVHYGAAGDRVRVNNGARANDSGGLVIDTLEFADGTTVGMQEFLNRRPEQNRSLDEQRLIEGAPFSMRLPDDLFIDPDGDDVLTRVAVAGYERLPEWLHYDAPTRTLSGTPGKGDAGEFDVIVQGMDSRGAERLADFHVTVQGNADRAPRVCSTPKACGLLAPLGHHLLQSDRLCIPSGHRNGSAQPQGQEPLDSFLRGFSAQPMAALAPLGAWIRNPLSGGLVAQHRAEQGIHCSDSRVIERHWTDLVQAVHRLNAEREWAPAWEHVNHGADLSGLAAVAMGGDPARGSAARVLSAGGAAPLQILAGPQERWSSLHG